LIQTNSQGKGELTQLVLRQREALKQFLRQPMQRLADQCMDVMHEPEKLEQRLSAHFREFPYCHYLWILDPSGFQLTGTVAAQNIDETQQGRDRASRPYVQRALNGDEFYLSEAYISRNRRRPSLSAVMLIQKDGKTVGVLGADFDLRELPNTAEHFHQNTHWRQIKGDPAIRGGLFQQSRIESVVDRNLDDVLSLVQEILISHGIFHAKLHFSSSRATLWRVDDPYEYQILNVDDLLDPDICLAYPRRKYFDRAVIPADKIGVILQMFRHLRFMDETVYLRSGSINIVNGMIGLNFSCDGSHYIFFEEFMNKESDFWLGV